MRKHRGSSTLNLPAGRQIREASTRYWQHAKNIRRLQCQLWDLCHARDDWEDKGYSATVEYLDARIQCLTGICLGGYQQRDKALAQIMGRKVKAA